jgi:hypothetical protein
MHAVCTCSHAFKHAMTFGEGADAAAAAATVPAYNTQTHRSFRVTRLQSIMPCLHRWSFSPCKSRVAVPL